VLELVCCGDKCSIAASRALLIDGWMEWWTVLLTAQHPYLGFTITLSAPSALSATRSYFAFSLAEHRSYKTDTQKFVTRCRFLLRRIVGISEPQ
jgi:hypothetical protein